MTKAAVFAAAIFGLAGAAQAVVVDFSNVGVRTSAANDADLVNSFDGGNYTLNFIDDTGVSAKYWANTDNFYGGTGFTHTSYMPGASPVWRVDIVADPGLEIVFDGYTMLRASSLSAGSDVTVQVDGATNDSSLSTGFAANDSVVRTFAPGSKPTGTTVSLFWDDNGNDVAIDEFNFTVQAIPEPTVLAPMALAGMGMFLRRRRA